MEIVIKKSCEDKNFRIVIARTDIYFFDETNIINLLRSVTLRILELVFNPFKRKLRSMALTLSGVYLLSY